MRYRALVKWHSRAFLLLDCHESHRLYNVEPLSISPQMYQRERRQSHEAPENALIAAPFNRREVDKPTFSRLCAQVDDNNWLLSRTRYLQVTKRSNSRVRWTQCPLFSAEKVDRSCRQAIQDSGFNLLNTHSRCSGSFVAAVSKIYLKLLE